MRLRPTLRGLIVLLLGLALPLAAQRELGDKAVAAALDDDAASCARAIPRYDPTGGDAVAHFGAAEIWGDCAYLAVFAIQHEIRDELDFLSRPEDKDLRSSRPFLKSRTSSEVTCS